MKNKEKLFYQLLAISLIIALVVCFVKIEDLRTRINHIFVGTQKAQVKFQ